MARLRVNILLRVLLTIHTASALPVRSSDSCDDMPSASRVARPKKYGFSRPSKDGEESLTPSWTDLRNMAESCAEFFEQEREGGDPGKARRSAEKARLKKIKNEDLQVIKDVLAKAEVEEEPAGADLGGAQRFWPNAPSNSCDTAEHNGSKGWLSIFDRTYAAASSLFAHLNPSQSLQRTRHDEVCYRENTFPKAKRYASADWLHILRTWPQSTVMIRILSPVIVTTAWTFVLALLHKGLPNLLLIFLQRISGCDPKTSPVALPCVAFSWLRGVNGGNGFKFLKGFSKQPHGIVGSAMSLLLVFRTNTAYTRFWEGRCLWESVSDYVRDITRFCVTYRAQVGESNLKRIADLLCAFPVALKHHLEGFMGQDQEDELANLVDPIDLPGVLSAVNRPLYITNALMHIIVHDIAYQMDQWTVRERLWLCSIINQLSKCVGGCERLVQTPVPLHYARHTGRFMGLFVLTLPLILVDDMGMLAVPAVAIMVWCIFGVQEIGLLIENPFSRIRRVGDAIEGSWALPLGVMAETMRFDVWDAIDGVAPPSMRKYARSKKERDKGFANQPPRPRLCPSLSATTVDGTAYQEVVSPISSRSATPHVEMRREGSRESSLASSQTVVDAVAAREVDEAAPGSDLSLLAASMHAATSRAAAGEGPGCGVDLEKAAAALKALDGGDTPALGESLGGYPVTGQLCGGGWVPPASTNTSAHAEGDERASGAGQKDLEDPSSDLRDDVQGQGDTVERQVERQGGEEDARPMERVDSSGGVGSAGV